MKKFIVYVLETAVICTAMIIMTFCGIVLYPENVFETSYQSVIQDKFRLLKETNEPKIIIICGSNGAYGIDQNMLEEATGYKVVNLGLHAGFRYLFPTELSKANMNAGDIVLLAYEYEWGSEGQFTSIGTDLVMTGIDSDVALYQYMPVRVWPSILGNLGMYAYQKNTFESAEGVYSRESFDTQTGQMVLLRDDIFDEYHANIYDFGTMDFFDWYVSDESAAYLRKYKSYVEKKGAEVYFVAPPLLRESVISDLGTVAAVKDMEEESVGIPYISDPIDYLYPETLMFNTIYHCNDRGEKERTRQLINDLNNAGIITIKNMEEYQRDKDDQIVFEYDLEKYLNAINDTDYTVFLSIKDEGTSDLTEDMIKAMKKLGLRTDLTGRDGSSYYAVISNEGIVEKVADEQLEANGVIESLDLEYSIISAGYACGNVSSIVINNVEYSRNMRGLNIVVYDNQKAEVIDSVCFDTFDGAGANR